MIICCQGHVYTYLYVLGKKEKPVDIPGEIQARSPSIFIPIFLFLLENWLSRNS